MRDPGRHRLRHRSRPPDHGPPTGHLGRDHGLPTRPSRPSLASVLAPPIRTKAPGNQEVPRLLAPRKPSSSQATSTAPATMIETPGAPHSPPPRRRPSPGLLRPPSPLGARRRRLALRLRRPHPHADRSRRRNLPAPEGPSRPGRGEGASRGRHRPPLLQPAPTLPRSQNFSPRVRSGSPPRSNRARSKTSSRPTGARCAWRTASS